MFVTVNYISGCLISHLTHSITYILITFFAEPFSYFEKEFPDLISIDSQGIIRNKINFLEQEREEMRLLTAALEISTNVWVNIRFSIKDILYSLPLNTIASINRRLGVYCY